MTLDKAIRVKENHQRLHLEEYYLELLEADNLSIEALKRLEENRTLHFIPSLKLLPGETKD